MLINAELGTELVRCLGRQGRARADALSIAATWKPANRRSTGPTPTRSKSGTRKPPSLLHTVRKDPQNRRRREAARLARADADALVRGHGEEAYRLARTFERDVNLPDGTTHQGRTPAHWRRVAILVARMTGRAVGLDTATRMADRRR